MVLWGYVKMTGAVYKRAMLILLDQQNIFHGTFEARIGVKNLLSLACMNCHKLLRRALLSISISSSTDFYSIGSLHRLPAACGAAPQPAQSRTFLYQLWVEAQRVQQARLRTWRCKQFRLLWLSAGKTFGMCTTHPAAYPII